MHRATVCGKTKPLLRTLDAFNTKTELSVGFVALSCLLTEAVLWDSRPSGAEQCTE